MVKISVVMKLILDHRQSRHLTVKVTGDPTVKDVVNQKF